jgi:arabinose-5-phosphate isomerase
MHVGDAIPLVPPETPMSEAILVMSEKSFGCVGVRAADGRLVGVITDGDLRRHMGDNLLALPVAQVMHPNPKTITASRLAGEALAMMTGRAPPTTSLFVVDDEERPTGFVHMHDCLRAGIA